MIPSVSQFSTNVKGVRIKFGKMALVTKTEVHSFTNQLVIQNLFL